MRSVTFTFACALAALACGSDNERPPAASSGGSSASSGGGSSSGGTSNDGGGSSSGTDGGGSSGGSSGGTAIATGLRASIDNAATEFTVSPKALRLNGGGAVDVSGTDSFGNQLRVTLTSTSGNVAPGSYDCSGSAGATYGIIGYDVSGGVATWTASAPGECTITVISIDNQAGGTAVGTFSGKAQRAASTERLITKGEFRLTLE